MCRLVFVIKYADFSSIVYPFTLSLLMSVLYGISQVSEPINFSSSSFLFLG